MGFKLTKKEVETLGMKFAEMQLHDKEANPVNLSVLAKSKDWKKALPHEKKQAISEIAQKARAALLECGYNKELVESVTEKHIRA